MEQRVSVHHTQSSNKCVVGCLSDHIIFKCKKFKDASVDERYNMVKRAQLCFNCLQPGHRNTYCEKTTKCKKCSNAHSSWLHSESPPPRPQNRPWQKNGKKTDSFHTSKPAAENCEGGNSSNSQRLDKLYSNGYPIIATAKVTIKDKYGVNHICRVMLDTAATSNFITKSCVKKLNLSSKKTSIHINGLGNSGVAKSNAETRLTFCAHFDHNINYSINALIVPSISCTQPVKRVDLSKLGHLKKLQLADDDFHEPAKIDILVGAELFYEITREVKSDLPMAIKSTLGWLVVEGKNYNPFADTTAFQTKSCEEPIDNLDATMNKFWELESVPTASAFSKEEHQCEEHFKKTYSRDSEGRFIVRYPFKGDPTTELGDSLFMAIRRYKQVERRLQKNEKHQLEYLKFMTEYLELGHMVEVAAPTPSSKFRYYIPHHFVMKDSSTTTKFRVVFDASAQTTSGKSLNDVMMVGPVIQESLNNLIIRFRKHKIVITADIEKMYRQVLIHPEDQEFQHIVWRETPDKPLRHFRLLTVTYGTAAGPYLATKALHTLADLEKKKFPIAAKVVKEDFYVDDCMSGSDNDENAIILHQQLIGLLKCGAMSIRKFTSNSEAVLNSLPEDLREKKFTSFDKDNGVKALGIFWSPTGDYFGFQTDLQSQPISVHPTKRQILSDIAKLFDPIGWLGPVVIRAKIIMQTIWKEKNIDWDDKVPDTIRIQWETFQSDLRKLHTLRIPREQNFDNKNSCLVGFSVASEQAYSACVYLCTYNPGKFSASLITSKTRVAPLMKKSLPRLELSGALLLAELLPTVADALKMDSPMMISFSDSTLVLHWLLAEPYQYKNFVGNRIAKIQELTPTNKWGFVQGIENPADCASRGISSQELIQHPLWWEGPAWLKDGQPVPKIPSFKKGPDLETPDLELKQNVSCHITIPKTSREIFIKFSRLEKLLRVLAYSYRFINKSRSTSLIKQGEVAEEKLNGCLTIPELNSVLRKLIVIAQEQEFPEEVQLLKDKKSLPNNSKILSLTPFLDEHNILRVGGRLRHAKITTHQKHPILLPQKH